MNIPNVLSCYRLAIAPVLLGLAWYGYSTAFLIVLLSSFLSDALDGLLARLLHQQSELGAALDTWGDFTIYITIVPCAWWLWPEIIKREALWVAVVVASYSLPAIVGLVKFGHFTSYHTWAVKLAAAAIGISVLIMFVTDLAWPFHLAVPISALAGLEEIAITLCISERRSNIPSFWHVLRSKE